MPVRPSTSRVLKWPDRATVDAAVRALVAQWVAAHPELRRAGCFGSYARGDWGVGSDVDLVVVVERSARPFAERALDFDVTPLPVPADLLVYTEDEWRALADTSPRFWQRLAAETVRVL